MKELHLSSIGGLFDELYNPDLNSLSLEPLSPANPDSLGRVNGLFWGQLLNPVSIADVISAMRNKYLFQECEVPQYAAILSNPSLFIKRVQLATRQIVNQGIEERDFFAHIETISILCKLYSDFKFYPYNLTIVDGFILNEFSSREIIQNCLTAPKNPYLSFLQKECFPVIAANPAEIVWIHGPIHTSVMAMAMYARQVNPDVRIFVVDHSSEYYSLNKITRFLKKNKMLFTVIDAIDLGETKATQELLRRAVSENKSFSHIENLLYIDRATGEILQTPYSAKFSVSFPDNIQTRRRSFQKNEEHIVDPYEFVNAKLFPESICPWHKCAFCGINHKYQMEGLRVSNESLEDRVEHIANLASKGKKYFWFYDEAVPPNQLELFADLLLQKNISIIWHIRSRINIEYNKELCIKLAQSGLREIRFGLESASYEVLKRMNKFDADFNLSQVEAIVSNFHNAGVSVHFPIIIGFPGETASERNDTYNYLRYLKEQYPSMSFNINILKLDISSELYKNFEEYNITAIQLPCSPQYFLGNTAEWAGDTGWFNRSELIEEQARIMRELLYPWLPQSAITPPNILYRLSETIRNTLIWKESLLSRNNKSIPLRVFSPKLELQLSPWTVISESNNLFASCYDLMYNNYIETIDKITIEFISLFQKPIYAKNAASIICKKHSLPEDACMELITLAAHLVELDILINEV